MSKQSELFELCKQVYEATGLGDMRDRRHLWTKVNEKGKAEYLCPLYTSDYLLEKLPPVLSDNDGDEYRITVHKVGDNWLANYIFDNVGMYHSYADTPLKALLKLAIALHESGVKIA